LMTQADKGFGLSQNAHMASPIGEKRSRCYHEDSFGGYHIFRVSELISPSQQKLLYSLCAVISDRQQMEMAIGFLRLAPVQKLGHSRHPVPRKSF
jgi:hypothetical protein